MECKPSTIHVLKVLKISYFGCSKRLFFLPAAALWVPARGG